MTTAPARPAARLARALTALLLLALGCAPVAAQATNTDGATPQGLAPGAPAGSYPLGGFESVNLFNGNLNFSLPLLRVGGRGSSSYTIPLRVEQKWRVMLFAKPLEGEAPEYTPVGSWWGDLTPGYGPGVVEGQRSGAGQPVGQQFCGSPSSGFFERTLTRLTFTGPDGTEHELHDRLTGGAPALAGDVPCTAPGKDRGTVFVTADGRSATFISDAPVADHKYNPMGTNDQFRPSGYLLLGDGSRARVASGLVRWMRDRNGNRTSFAYDGSNRVSAITDSLNRQVTITYAGANGNGLAYDLISFKGVGQQPRSVKVWHAALAGLLRQTRPSDSPVTKTYRALFGWLTKGSTVTHFNPGRVSAVELPDQRRYEFRYNEYGELARVALPTGGAFEYDWADCSEGADGMIYRRVAERRAYRDGSALEGRTTYSTAAGEEVQVRAYDAAGTLLSLSKHFFHGTGYDSMAGGWDPVSYPSGKTGRERRTEGYEVAGGAEVLKRAVEQTWARPDGAAECTQTPPASLFCPAPREPVVVTTLTTLADTNQVSKQTSVNPQTGAYGFDRYGQPTDLWEYDFGAAGAAQPGPLLRRTHTDYLTTNAVNGVDYASPSPAAASPHLRGLPARESVYDAAGVEQSRTTYEYDHYGTAANHAALVARAGMTGLCTTFDAAGACANSDPTAYTARGNVTAATSYLLSGGAVAGSVTAYSQYDVAGNVVKSVDARGHVSQAGYADAFSDGVGRNTYAFPTSATSPVPDPSGVHGSGTALVTASAYDFSTGLVTSATDANGQTTFVSYNDALDRPTRVDRPGGGWTTYWYGRNQYGDYVGTGSALDAARATVGYQYFDGLGRPHRSFSHDGQDPTKQWATTDVEYDALGRAWKTSLPYRSAGVEAAKFSGGRWSETAFDGLGRVRSVTTRPDNAAVRTAYSGNGVTVTDQAGKKRRSVTDALGWLREVTEAPEVAGCQADGAGCTTFYAYDALGNLRKVEQGGQLRFFMYDSLGRLVRAKNPEQAANASITATDPVTGNSQWSLSYSYDASGNLSARTDARGVTAAYTYDPLGRNTSVNYSDATPDVTRSYDLAALGRGRHWKSEAAGVSRATVSEYDARGRPKSSGRQFWAGGAWGAPFSVAHGYDLAGNVTSMTYPSGRSVSYTYDAAGRPSGFSGNLGDGVHRTYSEGITYDELGGVSREQFGTQTPLYSKRFYNERGQLSEVRLGTYHATDGGWWNRGAILNVYSATAGWTESGSDNNGNLRKQMVYLPHGDNPTGGDGWTELVQYYGYDALNRLKSVEEKLGNQTASFTQVYGYDRWGNRTVDAALTAGPVGERQFTVNVANNRLGVPAGQAGAMSYDAAGNLTQDTYTGSGTRAYDAEGRMTSAQFVSGQLQAAAYAYDADGRRVRRGLGAGGEVWQVYGAGGELLAEYAAGAQPSQPRKEYGYRAGELLVTVDAPAAGGQVHDAASGFSASQNPAGAWSYGYRAGGGAFTPYAATPALYGAGARTWAASSQSCCPMVTKNVTSADYTYAGAPSVVHPPGLLNLHPGPSGERSVVRWTAPASGTFTVSGRFEGIDTAGATSDVLVTHNGAALFGGAVAGYGSRAPFSATVTVAAGDAIEFSVGRGSDATYSHDSTGLAASVAAAGAGGGARWLVTDHLGTPRMVADQTGSLAGVTRHDYLPFGEEVGAGEGGRTITSGYSWSDSVRQGFTGYEKDGETGLNFAHARYYSPIQGRFTSVDPSDKSMKVENPQSWNRYNYCLNNPLLYIDENGKWPTSTHNKILAKAFDRLHPSRMAKMIQGAASVDRDLSNLRKLVSENTLIERFAFRHAMTPGSRVREIGLERAREEARGQANDFINTNIDKAKELNGRGKSAATIFGRDSLLSRSYHFFGEAAHTIMDNVSPAHGDFKVFDNSLLNLPGFGSAIWSLEQWIHTEEEDQDPTEAQMNQMVDALRRQYLQVYGEDAYKVAVSESERTRTKERQR